MKAIAMFNNKGGVGKTTFLCNIASYLSIKKRKKILVIDADPQCNTTSYVLDAEQFLDTYVDNKSFTIADILPSIEDGSGYIEDFKPLKTKYFGFDVVPGNPKFAVYEDFLANEWKDLNLVQIRGVKSTMLFSHFLSLCKCKDYEYVFFDMGPSLGAINRSVLLACDYFVTPMSSDVFSVLALKNIGESISNWRDIFNEKVGLLQESKKNTLRNLRLSCDIKFLGYVEQQYITKSTAGTPRIVHAYDKILKSIPKELQHNVIDKINSNVTSSMDYKIGSIPNFYSLVPMSQTAHKPIFNLGKDDGVVGAHYQKVKDFEDLFSNIANKMLKNVEAING